MSIQPSLHTAFAGMQCLGTGDLRHVAGAVKEWMDRGEQAHVLIFDDQSSEPVEIDFRGSLAEVLSRLPPPSVPDAAPAESTDTVPIARSPGRPKLGVVAREVTLLPRHWEWLSSQPGGASVTLRKLVEDRSRANAAKDRQRLAQESAYRFMSAIAGDLPGYEEAVRALFADAPEPFSLETAAWPTDVKAHAQKLAQRAFASVSAKPGK